jgi:hypothetical protein
MYKKIHTKCVEKFKVSQQNALEMGGNLTNKMKNIQI